MKTNYKLFTLLLGLAFSSFQVSAQETKESETTFKFGGYIKADFINTLYTNGDVSATSPLKDFHLPSQIPVGPADENYDLDYHVKESRFNFDVRTKLLDKDIHGFIELDFLLSAAGDEKVSNSFNPRIRHAFFEWDRLLIGQTWSTFMIVTIPDELDFSGGLDGLVFIRQPQIRYKAGSWMFSIENPESTITPFQEAGTVVTDDEISPDVVVRKNFSGKWGSWSLAGIYRNIHLNDTITKTTSGFGITTGGKLMVGKRGDDIRIQATYGEGLGRYLAAGFISGAVQDDQGDLNAIQSVNGFIAYNHFWIPQKLSSSFSATAFQAMHDDELIGGDANAMSYSLSGNIKYDPVPEMRLGIEYAYAVRELENGTDGAMHRIQIAFKYFFGYRNTTAYERD